jgi:hypothetical protein
LRNTIFNRLNYPIFSHSACCSFCHRKTHPIYYLCSLIPNEYCIMQKQERLLNVDWRYKTAFEKTRRENQALQGKINLQNYTIKRLRRELNKKNSLRDLIKNFFWIKLKKQKKEIFERPLRRKENQKKLVAMLENWLSIAQIVMETWWKRDNITEYIRIHSLKYLLKK